MPADNVLILRPAGPQPLDVPVPQRVVKRCFDVVSGAAQYGGL
jgi:hypothetical protein